MKHGATVTAASTKPLQMHFRWDRPLFTADDGIGPTGSLSLLDGMVLAFGSMDEEGTYVVGSGTMVAPGILVTATHVAEATRGTVGMAFSFLRHGRMRLWGAHELHVLYGTYEDPLHAFGSRRRTSDVSLVSCSLMSEAIDEHPLRMAHIEVAIPLPGERLWALGYRETLRAEVSEISMLCSSGLVTAQHLDGRGNLFPGPQVEVAMNTVGGMSGGPVFNADGHLVGLVSSSFETDDFQGPTFVSLIWPALVGDVTATWPHGFWPGQEANLMKARAAGHAKIYGDVSFHRSEPNFTVRLPSAEEKAWAALPVLREEHSL